MTQMRENRRLFGGFIGLAGAQVFTLLVFEAFARQCDCSAQVCINGQPKPECILGVTLGQFWALAGSVLGVAFFVFGAIIAGDSDSG